MNEPDWLAYLTAFEWECPECASKQRGVHEYEIGRICGRCKACGRFSLLYIWGGTGWINAVVNSIVLETD